MIKADGGQVVAQVGNALHLPDLAGLRPVRRRPRSERRLQQLPVRQCRCGRQVHEGGRIPEREVHRQRTWSRSSGSTGDPAPKTAAIANNAIQSLGFKTNFTLVDQSVMYQKYCGDPKQEIDACPNVGWIRDWSDPQTLLDPIFRRLQHRHHQQLQLGPGQLAGRSLPGQVRGDQDPAGPGDEGGREDGRRYGIGPPPGPTSTSSSSIRPSPSRGCSTSRATSSSKDVRPVNDLWNIGEFDYDYTSLK